MKTINYFNVSLVLIFFMISVSTVPVFCDEQKKAEEEEQKMMELWKKYTQPGDKHKHLEYFVGDWESVQKIFSKDDAEPTIMNQEIHVESLFEGRFTKAHIKSKGEFMGVNAEGIVITGYDNYKRQIVSVTFGNIGTDLTMVSGVLDETGRTRIDRGSRTSILTGKEYDTKAVTTIINQDKYTYEYYIIDPRGNEIKAMEITYTRKK